MIFGKFSNVCQWLDTDRRGMGNSIFLELILSCASYYAWIVALLNYFKAITIQSKSQLKKSTFNYLCFFHATLIVHFCELLFASSEPVPILIDHSFSTSLDNATDSHFLGPQKPTLLLKSLHILLGKIERHCSLCSCANFTTFCKDFSCWNYGLTDWLWLY